MPTNRFVYSVFQPSRMPQLLQTCGLCINMTGTCSSGHVRIGGEEHCSTKKMSGSPFDECFSIICNRSGRRTIDMLEDSIEHRSCVFREVGHELTELAVEVAKK